LCTVICNEVAVNERNIFAVQCFRIRSTLFNLLPGIAWLADYGSAIALKPNDVAPFWLRYAACLFEAQRDGEAIALARRVKSKFPGEAEVSVVLAGILSQAGTSAAAAGSERQQPAGLTEATNLYRSLPPVQREKYSNPVFLRDTVRWPPRLTAAVIALSKIRVDVDGVLLSLD